MVLVQPRDSKWRKMKQQIQVTETASRPLVSQFLLYLLPPLNLTCRVYYVTLEQLESQVSPFCLSWQMEFFHFTKEYHTNIITQPTNLIPLIYSRKGIGRGMKKQRKIKEAKIEKTKKKTRQCQKERKNKWKSLRDCFHINQVAT